MEAAHRRHDISARFGSFWNPTSLAEKEPEELLRVIIVIFSMRFFGSCEQVRRGEISRRTMGTGKIPIAVFVDGEIVENGKDYSKSSYPNHILNGL